MPYLAVIGNPSHCLGCRKPFENPCPSCPRSPHGDYGSCPECGPSESMARSRARKSRPSRNPAATPRVSPAAVAKYKEFHGAEPNNVSRLTVQDGSRKVTRRQVVEVGSVPELHVLLRDGRMMRKRFGSLPKMYYEAKTKKLIIRGGSLGSYGKRSGMIGHCPEIHYSKTPRGSNKSGKHWKHPCNPDDMPRVYWDASARELVLKGGDLTVSDWLRSSTDPH